MDKKDIQIIRVQPTEAPFDRADDGFFTPIPSEMEFCPHMDFISSHFFQEPSDLPLAVAVLVAVGCVDVIDASFERLMGDRPLWDRASSE